MDGFEVARRLLERGCQAKLIALTAFAQREFRRKANSAGYDVVLQKPATADQIEFVLTDPANSLRTLPSANADKWSSGGPQTGLVNELQTPIGPGRVPLRSLW